MTTIFTYLLIAFLVLFIISRVMNKDNRIDAFAKYLGCLACGLLLGAGAYHYFGDTQPEKSVVVTTGFIPTYQIDSCCMAEDNNTDMSQETIERDTEVIETEENLAQTVGNVEIEDDS